MTLDNRGPQGDVNTAETEQPASGTENAKPPVAPKERKASRKARSFWFELPILVVVAILVAVLVRTFLLQTFYIPSGSMENTLLPNDRVLVNKILYDFRDPHRGETIVFQPPSSWNVGPEKDDYIKRVIGVGGDHVVCCDAKGRITINGAPLVENYLYPGNAPSTVAFDVTVPDGRLFVMGDHRAASSDSRFHIEKNDDGSLSNDGTISVSSVVGRAFAIFWPLGRMSSLSVPKAFDEIPSS